MCSDDVLSASCHSREHQAPSCLPGTCQQRLSFFPKTVNSTRGRRGQCRFGPLNMSTERLCQAPSASARNVWFDKQRRLADNDEEGITI